MSDSSQTWCMVPTDPASDCATQAPTAVDESNAETMTALTNVAIEGKKDETYYWHTVNFSVEGTCFKVPRYQFVIGSTYFAGKLESTKLSDNDDDEASIALDGATASQFRVLLKLLFPIHTTSTTLKFTKEEWLVILELSTLWNFHEFRKLAKDHLEPQLDDPIERIVLGRAAYIPKWVLEGYETLVTRPDCISEQESERIGHLTTVRLYILRHKLSLEPGSGSVASRFRKEISNLKRKERGRMSSEERRMEEEKRLEDERQWHAQEEEQRLKEEKARAEREENERREREEQERLAAEQKERQEDEERRKAEEAQIEEERIAEEIWRKAEEERLEQERVAAKRKREEEEERRRKEGERLQKEADERIYKKEALRLEEERIAREFADLEKQEEEAQRKAEETRIEHERFEQERVEVERKRKEEEAEERRCREEEKLQKEADERIRKKEEELRLEEERIARELADLEKQEEEARLQEKKEREEREQMQGQSKAPSGGGFGNIWGGKASSSSSSSLFGNATLEESPHPAEPWLGLEDLKQSDDGSTGKIPPPIDAGVGWPGDDGFAAAGKKKKKRDD